jgi:hypothetical protein
MHQVFGILPIFIVKDLQMHRHQKAIVAVILGFAAVGSSATIIRLPWVWTVEQYKGEFLWRTADVAIWTTVEVGIGITAGNLGTLRPLLTKLRSAMGITNSTGRDATGWTRRQNAYSNNGATALEDFGGKSRNVKTTVTIRGGASSEESKWGGISRTDSEDEIVSSSDKYHEGGILHSVQIDTFEERVRTRDGEGARIGDGNTSPRPILAYERV